MLTTRARQLLLRTIAELAHSLIEETANDSRLVSISSTEIHVAWFESSLLRSAIMITREIDDKGQKTYHIETAKMEENGSIPTRTLWSLSEMISSDDKLYVSAMNNKEALFRWNNIPEKPLRKLLSVLCTCEYRPWIPKETRRLEITMEDRGIDV